MPGSASYQIEARGAGRRKGIQVPVNTNKLVKTSSRARPWIPSVATYLKVDILVHSCEYPTKCFLSAFFEVAAMLGIEMWPISDCIASGPGSL